MDKYTEILEFFMENGVSLSKEQMSELKSVCESKNSGVANRLIKDKDSVDMDKISVSATDLRDAQKYNDSHGYGKYNTEIVPRIKDHYGQGKKNMPKNRESGKYLAAQKAINDIKNDLKKDK